MRFYLDPALILLDSEVDPYNSSVKLKKLKVKPSHLVELIDKTAVDSSFCEQDITERDLFVEILVQHITDWSRFMSEDR